MCNKSEKENTKNIGIHFIYVVIILVGLIVLISTLRLSDNQHVTEILSFAGTVTSIILSVLAIFITVLSNGSMSSLMEKIRTLTESISPMGKYISDASEKIDKSTESLQSTQKEVSSNLQKSSDIILQSTKELEKNLSEVINDSVTKNMQSLRSEIIIKEPTLSASTNINAVDIEYFISKISLIGKLILYFLYKNKDNQNDILLKDISALVGVSDDYIHGFLVASSSAKIIDYEYSKTESFGLKNIKIVENISEHDIRKDIPSSKNDIICKIDTFTASLILKS